MKKKFLLPILSVCMVVALVSVGFAAWLITGSNTEDATGSFVTHDVTNEYFTAKAEVVDEGKIEFGKGNAKTTNQTPWFTFSGESKEILEATFMITVVPDVTGNLDSILSKNNIKVTLKAIGSQYDAAVQNGIVACPTISCYNTTTTTTTTATATNLEQGVSITLTAADFTLDETIVNGEAIVKFKATVKVNFAWGEGGNPYTYYNETYKTADAVTQKVRTAATTAIKTLNEINNQQYDIILEVVSAAPVLNR